MSSLPPGLLEVQRKLLQTIEDLRQEFLARTDELTIVISAMDQFGSMTVDQLSLTDPLDEGSVLDLGLRFIPEDYKAAISANKTSAAPIFAEKKRASISGRTSVGANGGGAGVGGRRRSSAVTTVLQAAGIRRSVTKSASSLQKKSLASIARSTSSKEKISSPSELDEPTIPKMGTDDSDFEAVERGGLTLSAHQPTGHSVISIHTNDVYELNASALKMSSRDHSRLGNTVPSASSLSADWAIASRESMKSSGLKLPISTVSQNSSKKENKDMDDGDDGLGTFGLKLPFGTVSKPERQKKIGEQAADVGKLGLKLPPSHAMEESDQLGGLKLPPAKAGQHRRKSYDLLEVSSLNNSHNSISSNSTRQSGSRMPSEISAAGQRRRSSTTPPVVEDSRNSSGKAKWSVIKATIALSAMARSSVKPAAQQISPTTPGPAKGFSVTREGHRDFAPQLSQENNVVGRKEESVAVVVPTVLKDDEEDSILEKRLASKQKTAVMSEMEVEGDEDRLGSIKPRRVPNKTNKVPGTPTAPKLTIKEEFQHHHFVLNFLIPVFDNKGRVVDLDQFDRADIADAAFSVCGLHPRSLFSSYWDFVMTILYLLMLWLLPFSICFTITDFDSPNSRGISDELSTVCSVICLSGRFVDFSYYAASFGSLHHGKFS
ncbi:hypothetical protein BC830DRAFT_657340 [Chytriomyces sp. MP71]|nr:hypothetical protein BC830DRAFT_657340 [Chytriomyces sp. MP71]